ncbi:MAG: glutamate 5-kinase, partial [Planctomycetota bacterium]
GDVVAVESFDGEPVAHGLCNLASHELERVKGLESHVLPEVLGGHVNSVVIHRDNLVMLRD